MPPGSEEPFRAYLPEMPGWLDPVIYIVLALMVVMIARDATLRLRRYGIGWRRFLGELRTALTTRPGTVLAALGHDVLGQGRVRRDPRAGVFHALIFGSFILLTIGTALIGIEKDLTAQVGIRFLHGPFYLAYEVVLDTAGLVLMGGVLLAMLRRYRNPPAYLEPRPTVPLVYALLLFFPISGFVLEAFRLLVTAPPWAGYSYVGDAVARAIAPVVGSRPVELYWVAWAVHFVAAFGAMATVLRTAFDHVVVLPLTVIFGAGRDPATLALPFNLATADPEALEEVSAGVGHVTQLDWRVRFSLDACVECGRCDRACPALASGRQLSPRLLVRALGDEIRTTVGTGAGDGDLFSRGVVAETTVWSCLECGACAVECPAWIDHPGTIVELRRHLVGEGRLDEAKAVLSSNIERNGNPLGLPSFERAGWLTALGVPSIREAPDAEYLYWIGCMASYDPAARSIAVAMIRILRHAGISFAVLGEEERCTGESARKMGDEAGFQIRAMENIALLQEVGAHRILTHCPHCLDTLSKDYPAFGGAFEVVHHTELLRDLIRQGRIPEPGGGPGRGVTYHDPCNLGRLRGEYEAPREVARFVSGAEVVEPGRSGDRSFCCGAGGGSYWWTVPEERKVSHLRLEQLRATGAGTVATACPFCLVMLSDAARVTGDEGVRIVDLAVLVASCLPEPAAV